MMGKVKKSHRAQGSTVDRLIKKNKPRHDFVRTPTDIVELMIKMAKLEKGMTVLDPCIGDGKIYSILKKVTDNVIGIEMHPDLFEISVSKAGWNCMLGNFLKTTPEDMGCGKVDVVIMNPPFSKLGALKFVQHAVNNWIVPNGKCVSVVPQYVLDNGEGRKPWLDDHSWCSRILPKHIFAPDARTLHVSAIEFRQEIRPRDSAFGYYMEEGISQKQSAKYSKI